VPWNKGKLTGAKPPLRPKHIWSIRTKPQIEGRVRDLAMFKVLLDEKQSPTELPCPKPMRTAQATAERKAKRGKSNTSR
jgi:hypothetical protein